jgi:CHAT domain-containing protein/tetratricopeptide (TPR) repeat protein
MGDPREADYVALRSWLALADDPRQQLVYLLDHPALLSKASEDLLQDLAGKEHDSPEFQTALASAQGLLHDIQQRGATPDAARDAYVNRSSGYVLPLPQSILQGIVSIQRAIRSGVDSLELAQHYRDLIQQASAESAIPPEALAELYRKLGGVLMSASHADDPVRVQEEAIQAYKMALGIYTRTRFPDQHAATQVELAVAYLHRITGDKRRNIERARSLCEAALRQFARVHAEQSIADTLNNLGFCYMERIAGRRQDNLTAARSAFERALQYYTPDRSPHEHARIQVNLGSVYEETRTGDSRMSLERAIVCYDAAIRLASGESAIDWEILAAAHVNRGNAYRRRIRGDRDDNLEEGIASYRQALAFYTRDRFPRIWAIIQENLALTYAERREGLVWRHREKAIACLRRALRVTERYQLAEQAAQIHTNLGGIYVDRLCGDRASNLYQATHHYQTAAQTFTRETRPDKWAEIQTNFGLVCYEQLRMGKQDATAEAEMIGHFQAALEVFTLESFPVEHRQTQIRLGRAYSQLTDWVNAWRAYKGALAAEDLLVELGIGVAGKASILSEEAGAAENGGLALTRLGQLEEAIFMIEQGRARGLAQAIAFDLASPERIHDSSLRRRYQHVRDEFVSAQDDLHAQLVSAGDDQEHRMRELRALEAFALAQQRFQSVVTAIKEGEDPPSFFESSVDRSRIQEASQRCGPGHAIIFLMSSLWGGAALAILHDQRNRIKYRALPLPIVTTEFLQTLIQTEVAGKLPIMTGGYLHAQEGNGFILLRQYQAHPSRLTFRDLSNQYQDRCQGYPSTLARAAQTVITTAEKEAWVDRPLGRLSSTQVAQCFRNLDAWFLTYELDRCLPMLADAIMRPLAEWLSAQKGVSSVTLIPCGRLAILPLSGAEIAPDQAFVERFSTSYAPSLRALRQVDANEHGRSGVYALGNPYPSPEELWWGEMEARTVVACAGQPKNVRVQRDADRRWLFQALRSGEVVEISSHAAFESRNALRSGLLLADGRWTLADMMSSAAYAGGLRLAILSGCQTAHLDIRGARDEVFSLAVGMIQAGVAATLATLWRVDDRATYVLTCRFVQEWFPHMAIEPPAIALARAQHWMRTVTCKELRDWQAPGTNLPFEVHEAARQLRYEMSLVADENMRCFAAPYFWAGFHITGW